MDWLASMDFRCRHHRHHRHLQNSIYSSRHCPLTDHVSELFTPSTHWRHDTNTETETDTQYGWTQYIYRQTCEHTVRFLTFSSSLIVAGDTSECRRSSGLRGGANPKPLPVDSCWLEPNLTSECRRCNASMTGTSNIDSVESCGMHTRDAIFRRHTLHRHVSF